MTNLPTTHVNLDHLDDLRKRWVELSQSPTPDYVELHVFAADAAEAIQHVRTAFTRDP